MKKLLSKVVKILVDHKVAILLITTITLIVWHKVFFQIPIGEGYYYFSPEQNIFLSKMTFEDLKAFDFFAQSIFPVLIALFKDHLVFYMCFQMLVFLIVYYCYYFSLFEITKNKWLSFSSTVFFIASYVGSFTMVGTANYQRFIQRVPNLIPLFMSIIFLVRFLNNRKLKYFVYSYALFVVSVFLARFSVFLLPVFIFYPIVDYFFSDQNQKHILNLALPLPFIATSFVFSFFSVLKPSIGIITFALTHPHVIEKTLYQVPSILVPYDLVIFIAKHTSPLMFYPYTHLLEVSLVVVGIVLFISLLKFQNKHSALFKLYLISILTILAVSFFNMYSYDGNPSPLSNFGEDRIYFIPSIFASVIWAVLIWLCFKKNPGRYKIMSGVLITLYLLLNVNQIWPKMNQIQYVSTEMRNFINYVKTMPDSQQVLIAPSHLAWPGILVTRFYKGKDFIIDTGYDGWEDRLKNIDRENISVIDYDFEGSNLEASRSAQGKVIDITEEFRKTKQIHFK